MNLKSKQQSAGRRALVRLTNGALVLAVAATAGCAGLAGTKAPEGGQATGSNLPTFERVAKDFPGCVSMKDWNRSVRGLAEDDLARIPSRSLVVGLDGVARTVDTAEAWEVAETASKNTYWILGAC